MKNLLMAMVVLFLVCTPVHADWEVRASLLPGSYKLVYTDLASTAEIEYLKHLALGGDNLVVVLGVDSVLSGITFKIDADSSTKNLASFLNNPPTTLEEANPTLFVDRDGSWKQVPLPVVWSDAVKIEM